MVKRTSIASRKLLIFTNTLFFVSLDHSFYKTRSAVVVSRRYTNWMDKERQKIDNRLPGYRKSMNEISIHLVSQTADGRLSKIIVGPHSEPNQGSPAQDKETLASTSIHCNDRGQTRTFITGMWMQQAEISELVYNQSNESIEERLGMIRQVHGPINASTNVFSWGKCYNFMP